MKNAKKITSILIILSVSTVMFAGCGSKSANASSQGTTATTSTTGQKNNKKNDPVAMKILYTNTLKSLVTAGTITQAQSDKVLEAETKNVPKVAETDKQEGTVKPSGTDKPDGRRPSNSRLNVLVTSKVITQAQADTINQNIREAMKNSQSTQN